MPPECMELWARRFEIKEGLSDGKAWDLSGSRALFFLQDVLMTVLELLAFPSGWYFGWEETLGTA